MVYLFKNNILKYIMIINYIFFHNEWTDRCFLDTGNNRLQREIHNYEYGNYNIINDEIIIKWDNWEGNDIFIKKDDYYYNKNFYDLYIKNSNLIEFEFVHKEWTDNCILNTNTNFIFKKNKISETGTFNLNQNNIIIKWSNWGDEKFIKINKKYYQENYVVQRLKLENELNDDSYEKFSHEQVIQRFTELNSELNKLENITPSKSINIKNNCQKFVKIDNKYYLNNMSNIPQLNTKKYTYKVLENNLNITEINNNLKLLITNSILSNKNYINTYNVNNYLESNNNNSLENLFNDLLILNININILPKNKKRCLSLVEWGYPPFGGGENWLLSFNKIIKKNDYDNYLICFSDPFKNEYFTEIKIYDLEYVKVIQMPKNIIEIIKIIKIIEPDFINHQGINRLYFMKISNLLEIPFLTGFCFWNDIINTNIHNFNINMLSNERLTRTDDFDFILNNSYNYVSSNFVNDIINKFYNLRLDVIETISLNDEFIINKNFLDNQKYVTLINCHYSKGGYLIKYLCENLDINIPLQLVYTENDPNITVELLTELIKDRNNKNNINILIPKKIDVRLVYEKTKILLIPSLCEETFCRVGYEAMQNKIPILSSKNGNLKYLLKDYGIFIEDYNIKDWKDNIEKLYINNKDIDEFKNKNYNVLSEDIIKNKITNKIDSIKESKYKLNDKNIGLIIPWADQGLGIQGRDYYITLKEIGFNPYVLSFKPYHSNYDNVYLQSEKTEWDYENIMYSNNYRENLKYDEIIDFIYKYNIKKIIIIEATFLNVFNICALLKLFKIKVYLVVNIECLRLVELNYHDLFDYILTNNIESQIIMSTLFKDKAKHLGFNLNHPYFGLVEKKNRENSKKLNFFCLGGLNSLSRKNIDIIIKVFFEISKENIDLEWTLNVYIQGVEYPDIINSYQTENIKYHLNNLSYKDIIKKYTENDIFIHMGSHEGLGLGFFESLYCGTPVLTMNWTPNNEIISNYINGWLINCSYSNINDNDNSIINMGIIRDIDLKNKVIEIINDEKSTLRIINDTIDNKKNIYIKNKTTFERNLLDIINS
jgi:hypothetical protein